MQVRKNKMQVILKNKTTRKKGHLLQSARQLFLTLSQTQLTVQEVYERLLSEDKIEHLAVVLETHTKDLNKGKHIHVYLSYLKKRELSLRHFDFLQNGVHVEKVKNTQALLAYMSKENECKANFDVWRNLLASRVTFARTLNRMVELGYALSEIQSIYANELADKPWVTVSRFVHEVEYLKSNPAKGLAQALRWIDRDLIEARLTPKELAIFNSDPQFQTLVDYINKVKKFGSEQEHKKCCLSIVSGPSTGKTSLLLKLAEHYNNYDFPVDGWHSRSYRQHYYSMWTWNEWSFGNVSMEDMLTLTEGLKTDLRVKGSKTFKADRPMLFLLDNESWKCKYERRFEYLKRQMLKTYEVRLKAFEVRIHELDFGNKNLFFLQKLLVSVSDDA
mgnify:CR=1 FL=1